MIPLGSEQRRQRHGNNYYLKMKTKNETRRFEVIVGNIGSVELTDNDAIQGAIELISGEEEE